MHCQTFQEVASKYALMLDLNDQAPLTEWNNSLNQLLTAKRGDVAKQRNAALKQKAERECAELQEASRIVGLQCLFAELRRYLQEDKQETFEWQIGKRETQALLPQQAAREFGEYMELRDAAKKKWPGVKLPPLGAAPETKLPSPDPNVQASFLRRELSSPLKFDRGTVGFRNSWQKTCVRASRDLTTAQIQTFQDLFIHPEPPLDALKMSKDKFKQMAGTSEKRGPEQEVGMLLYLRAIFVALVRLEKKITTLPDTALIAGIRWALGLEWLDGQTKELFFTAKAAMEKGRPGRKPGPP